MLAISWWVNGAAMSKSKGNMVTLGDQIERYGVDAVRLTMVFAGPPEEDVDWARRLSPGEQQRLAFARIFLQKPAWIFMDEATSSIDESGEGDLYRRLIRELPDAAVVSVGHRSTLEAFHNQRFVLEGQGEWHSEPIERG